VSQGAVLLSAAHPHEVAHGVLEGFELGWLVVGDLNADHGFLQS